LVRFFFPLTLSSGLKVFFAPVANAPSPLQPTLPLHCNPFLVFFFFFSSTPVPPQLQNAVCLVCPLGPLIFVPLLFHPLHSPAFFCRLLFSPPFNGSLFFYRAQLVRPYSGGSSSRSGSSPPFFVSPLHVLRPITSGDFSSTSPLISLEFSRERAQPHSHILSFFFYRLLETSSPLFFPAITFCRFFEVAISVSSNSLAFLSLTFQSDSILNSFLIPSQFGSIPARTSVFKAATHFPTPFFFSAPGF